MNAYHPTETDAEIQAGNVTLDGILTVPRNAAGVVVFAHGSGSSRFSARNRYVAEALNRAGMATLLMDLLTATEEIIDRRTRRLRFDIPLLAGRLTGAIGWLRGRSPFAGLPVGLFGSSTGSAAVLIAAAREPEAVGAIVSRGGRPDLAREALPKVKAPTLFIVGGNDRQVLDLNLEAARFMTVSPRLEIVPGASHLFEEPGKLEEVAGLACNWFRQKLFHDPPGGSGG